MRFGICTGMSNAPILQAAGYDYIELSVAGDLIPDEPDSVWTEKRTAILSLTDNTGVIPEAFNSFVRTGKIVGPEADFVRLEKYVHTAQLRAAEIGGKVIVFGSGGARQVPDDFSRAEAEAQIIRFLHLCADAYEQTGVLTVIEPLSSRECNILTTVSEGAIYVRKVNRPGVLLLADTYHMVQDGEPLDAIIHNGDILAHAHTAETKRSWPGNEDYDFGAMFRAFAAADYDERLSIECSWTDLASQAAPALAHLKKAMEAV